MWNEHCVQIIGAKRSKFLILPIRANGPCSFQFLEIDDFVTTAEMQKTAPTIRNFTARRLLSETSGTVNDKTTFSLIPSQTPSPFLLFCTLLFLLGMEEYTFEAHNLISSRYIFRYREMKERNAAKNARPALILLGQINIWKRRTYTHTHIHICTHYAPQLAL